MILYSNNCPKCNILKAELDRREISYTICSDLDQMKELGISSVPILEITPVKLPFKDALEYIRRN